MWSSQTIRYAGIMVGSVASSVNSKLFKMSIALSLTHTLTARCQVILYFYHATKLKSMVREFSPDQYKRSHKYRDILKTTAFSLQPWLQERHTGYNIAKKITNVRKTF